MSNLRYPIFKLPEYYIRDYEKRELPRYIKWWLYQSYLRKFHQKLSDIITGSNFTLEDTVLRKFNIIEIQGNTEQKTLTGRNFLPIISEQTKTENGITLKSNGDGSYTVSGTSTGDGTITFNFAETFTLPNSTLYWHIRNNEVVGGLSLYLGNSQTSSSPAFSSANRIMTSASLTNLSPTVFGVIFSSGTTVNITFSPSIELTDSATDYEQYCGGIPSPNPSYPQAIKNVTGDVNVMIQNKNIWNNELETAEYNSQGEKVTTYVWLVNTQKIKVKPNKTYSVSQKETPSQYRIIFFNGNNYLSKIDNTQNVTTGYSNYSFTTPNNCNYIYIQFRSTLEVIASGTYGMTPSDITEVQLEENSTATSYVEHQEQNLPFTLAEGQKLMLGGSLQDDGIHNVRRQVVLNGSETWVKNIAITNTNAYYCSDITDNMARGQVICSHFLQKSSYTEDIGIYSGASINFLDSEISTVEDFKTWLASNNVIVEYELAEEEITPYTETQQEQYNAIQEAKTYKDRTYIESSSSEINPILRIQYYEKKE